VMAAVIPGRDAARADAPAAREEGIEVALEAWRRIGGPRGTPAAVIAQLETAIRATVAAAEFRQASERLGVRPAYLPAAQFAELIAREDAAIARLMQGVSLKK